MIPGMLPIIELRGSPYDQGLTHGRALRERVKVNRDTYFDRFLREGGLEAKEVLLRSGAYWARVLSDSPDYASGVAGIAEGAGLPLLEVAALNLRYELLYHQFTQTALADGCTLFALSPERMENGHLVVGQNWDWIPQVQGAILDVREDGDAPDQLRFTEAGIFGGKIGLNAAGVGLVLNGLTSTDDDWSRMTTPFHVRCWEILRQHSLDAAVSIVVDEDRPCSTHYLIAQAPDGVAGLEVAPRVHLRLEPEVGVYAHANHFRDENAIGVAMPPSPYRHGSVLREARCKTLLSEHQGKLTIPEVLDYMRDHQDRPNSVCRHPDPERGEANAYETVTSAVMDLNTLELWISDGPPCENDYQHLHLEIEEEKRRDMREGSS